MFTGKHLPSAGCTGTCDQGREPCNCALRMPPPAQPGNVVPLHRRAGDVPSAFAPTAFGDDDEHAKGLIGNEDGIKWLRRYILATVVIVGVVTWARWA